MGDFFGCCRGAVLGGDAGGCHCCCLFQGGNFATTTMNEKIRSKKKQKWYQSDWDIWLRRPMQGRSLKAQCTLIVGILVWVILGCSMYFRTRENESSANL